MAVLCKGDGLCNAKCPTGAIQLKHYTDEELLNQIKAGLQETILPEEDRGSEPAAREVG